MPEPLYTDTLKIEITSFHDWPTLRVGVNGENEPLVISATSTLGGNCEPQNAALPADHGCSSTGNSISSLAWCGSSASIGDILTIKLANGPTTITSLDIEGSYAGAVDEFKLYYDLSCPDGWTQYGENQKCLKVVNQGNSFDGHEANCQELAKELAPEGWMGNLVSFHSQHDLDVAGAVCRTVLNYSDGCFGGYGCRTGLSFDGESAFFSDGSTVDYLPTSQTNIWGETFAWNEGQEQCAQLADNNDGTDCNNLRTFANGGSCSSGHRKNKGLCQISPVHHIPNTYCRYYAQGGDLFNCSTGADFNEVWQRCIDDGKNACMGVMWHACTGEHSDTTVPGSWKLMTAGQEVGDAENPSATCGGKGQAIGMWDVYVRSDL